ncbi:hypothetical protein B296_00004940 [Ensete ventricosum]|uniref:Uncharacterized protein n=1 Tax=Ensete ventricosum TaxID=4639 RepID=A0A426ZAI9_ENSVE|nr:hypothetical protein B296_00004940 [Ensete ventricosum]
MSSLQYLTCRQPHTVRGVAGWSAHCIRFVMPLVTCYQGCYRLVGPSRPLYYVVSRLLSGVRYGSPRISGGRAPAHRRWPHRRRPLTSKGSGCRAQRRRPNARKAVVTARTGGGCGQRRHHTQGGGLPRPLAAAAGRGGVAPAR